VVLHAGADALREPRQIFKFEEVLSPHDGAIIPKRIVFAWPLARHAQTRRRARR
jgi:hypothetical protein